MGRPVSNHCPICECDPCDCGWGSYCGIEKRKPDRVSVTQKPWWEYDGDDLNNPIASTWSHYDDCLEHIEQLCGASGFAGTYTGTVVLNYKIGDPVRYFPNCSLQQDEGVWIIKDVVNKHSLDCSWYDYEITNGSKTALCRQDELFKLEI